jgi:hypothetical protein
MSEDTLHKSGKRSKNTKDDKNITTEIVMGTVVM